MKISEKDIFNFVFCKSKLSLEMILQIESDPGCIDKIEYYKELYTAAEEDDDLDGEIISKLSLSIPAFKPEAIDLYPKDSYSYMDKWNKYLARVETSLKKTHIYLFSRSNDIVSNYSLTLMPSGKTIRQANNLSPASTSKQSKIELIKLKFF
ncbi:MAG: hypothetical protein ACM3MI_05335 [Clostridiales bacterium]